MLKGDQPQIGEKVVLQPIVFADPVTRDHSRTMFFRYEATTDNNGRFIFNRVVDGKSQLYIEHHLNSEDPVSNGARGNMQNIELQPGDRKVLQLAAAADR